MDHKGDLSNTLKAVREGATCTPGANTAGRGTAGNREPKQALTRCERNNRSSTAVQSDSTGCWALLCTPGAHCPQGLARWRATVGKVRARQPRAASPLTSIRVPGPQVPTSRFRGLSGPRCLPPEDEC